MPQSWAAGCFCGVMSLDLLLLSVGEYSLSVLLLLLQVDEYTYNTIVADVCLYSMPSFTFDIQVSAYLPKKRKREEEEEKEEREGERKQKSDGSKRERRQENSRRKPASWLSWLDCS